MNTMNTFIKMFSIDFIPILHLKRGDARRSRRGAVVPVYYTLVDCNALTPLLQSVDDFSAICFNCRNKL